MNLGQTMPYVSPNIVIVPTKALRTTKNKPLDQCHKDKVSTMFRKEPSSAIITPDTSQEVDGIRQSEATVASNLNRNDTVTTTPIVRGTGQTVTAPDTTQNECARANTSAPPNDSKQQNSGHGNSTRNNRANVLCTPNDSITHNVEEKDEKNKKPLIKINLISRPKVTNNDVTTAPTDPVLVQTESLNMGSLTDVTWNAPPVPPIPTNYTYTWTTPYPYQPIYPTPSTSFGPTLNDLTLQYQANTIYTQNENLTSKNTNYIPNKLNESSYTHYYTPSYKSPMDSAWLNDQYYTQLINDHSYKYCKPSSQYETDHTKLTIATSDVHNYKTLHLDRNTSVDENIKKLNYKPNNNYTIPKETGEQKSSKSTKNKKLINPDSFNLANDFDKELTSSESKVKKQTHQTPDLKSKKSSKSKLKNDKFDMGKSDLEASQAQIDILRKQIQELENIMAEKRKRYKDTTSSSKRLHDKQEEEPPVKKIKLNNNSEDDKKQNRDPGLKNKSKYSTDSIPEPSKTRVRRSSNAEYQPKKRVRSNSEYVETRPNMATYKKSQMRHPRIQPPKVSKTKVSDDESQSDFDLRSKLSRVNYNKHKRNKTISESQVNEKREIERENLLITINSNEDEVSQSKPDPSTIKRKPQKYKKIQLVINVICENQGSSGNSSSDENKSNDSENAAVRIANAETESESTTKCDLSFLDDFNIDEIVDSLKQQRQIVLSTPKADVQQNVQQSVTSNTNSDNIKNIEYTNSITINKQFVQPIMIKSEIKTEPGDFEENPNEAIPERVMNINNSGFLHNGKNKHTETDSVRNEANEHNCLDVLHDIKQEKYDKSDENTQRDLGSKCQKEHQPPTLQNEAYVLRGDIPKTPNLQTGDTTIENTQKCIRDTSVSESTRTIKIEHPEIDYVVNEEDDSPVNTANNLQEEIDVDLLDENTLVLETYSACEPMEIDETFSFCFPDFKKPIMEEKSCDLNICEDTENPTCNDKSPLTVTEIIQANAEKEIADNLTLDKTINNNEGDVKIDIDTTTIELTQCSSNIAENGATSIKTRPSQNTNDKTSEFEKNTDTTKLGESIGVFQAAEAEEVNNNVVHSDIKTGDTAISQLMNVENNEKVEETTPSVIEESKAIIEETNNKFKQSNKTDHAPTNISEKKNAANQVLTNTSETLRKSDIGQENTKLSQNKKMVNNTDSTKTSLISPSIEEKVVQHEIQGKSSEEKVTPITISKSGDGIKVDNIKLPQQKKMVDDTHDSMKKPLPSPLIKVKQHKIQEKASGEKVTPTTSKTATIVQNNNTSDGKNPKNIKTVQIEPLLKDDEVLALKIEERILQYLKLKVKVTSLICTGQFSKIFHCKGKKQQYALKFICDENKRISHGAKKEAMLNALQLDIPKQNLNTVYLINGFALVRNWCFLMEYYPKNLRIVLNSTVLDMDTVQILAKQLVFAVLVMKNKNIVHSDIRPTHILVDASNTRLKVCGFDEAYNLSELRVALPNIGTSGYRAPEVIMGFSADFAIDAWTTAQVMYEMVSGRRLFTPGYNNNTLFQHMRLLGFPPTNMIQQSRFGPTYFFGDNFKKKTGPKKEQFVLYNKVQFDHKKEIYPFLYDIAISRWGRLGMKQNRGEDLKKLSLLCTLLDNMLTIHPRRRIPIEFVCADNFFSYKCKVQPSDFTSDSF